MLEKHEGAEPRREERGEERREEARRGVEWAAQEGRSYEHVLASW